MMITSLAAFGNDRSINISNHLTYNEGLSHFGVTSLEVDHQGFVWIGTFKGLNLYDGYEFKTFFKEDFPALGSNRITTLFKDSKNNIIIGTEKGITLYRYEEDRFESLYELEETKNTPINDIEETENYIICNTILGDLLMFNKTTYALEKKVHPLKIENKNYKTFKISHFVDDQILLATNRGLIQFDPFTGRKIYILGGQLEYCVDVTFDGNKQIYALSYFDLYVFNYNKEGKSISFVSKVLDNQKFSKLKLSDEGELWLMKNNNKVALIPSPSYVKNIGQSIVFHTFRDDFTRLSSIALTNKGGWIGSFNQGFFQFFNEQPTFKYSALKEKYSENRSSQVLNILPFGPDKVYITLNANENKVVDLRTQQIINLEHPKVNNQRISRVTRDQFGAIWGGSRRKGIFRMKNLSSDWKQVKNIPEIIDEGARAFTTDRHGNIWLAGLDRLYRIQLDTQGEIKNIDFVEDLGDISYDINLLVNMLYADPKDDVLWICTNGKGLIRFKYRNDQSLSDGGEVTEIRDKDNKISIYENSVTCIRRTLNDELWIGVLEKGLIKINESNGLFSFDQITEKDGLDDNDVMSIEFDKGNRLWVATNRGINQVDPRTKKIINFTTNEGIVPASFEVTSTKLSNDRMVFGGNNGLCYFDPYAVKYHSEQPQLLFGDLRVHNAKVNITANDEEGVLKKRLNETAKIKLNHDQNSLGIELISLHFRNANTHNLRYRLLPKETTWRVTSSKDKIATYNLLPAGEYTFEAQASNANNEWSAVKSLKIQIREPWWNTTFAKIFYVFVFLLVLSIGIGILLRFKSLRYKLKLEHLESSRLKELDAARLKLFMNISHEFRTPLTLINGPINVLRNMFENNKDAYEHIDLIQRQSKKMLQLVNQVHEVRKADQNLLKLKIAAFDFTHLITDVKKDFEQLAINSNKKLNLVGETNQLTIRADKGKLEMVINNLLNNAFKFTKEGDEITISYSFSGEDLCFSIEDTGFGISKEDQKHVFKRFYQSDEKEVYSVGSGIGLELSKMIIDLHKGKIQVSSEIGKGTKFEITLPVGVVEEDAPSQLRLEEVLQEEDHDQKQRIVNENMDLSFITKDGRNKDSLIFYAEDNVDLRNFVSNVLSQHYRVKTFNNGAECIKALEEEWPSLIISDILMPEMNGLEMCRQIKDDLQTSHLPVVLLTSQSSSDEKIEGMSVGADAYLTKPFEMKQLVATIQNILNNRSKIQERLKSEVPLPISKQKISDSDQQFLDGLSKLLQDNLSNENIDLEEFSRELMMSRSQFFRKIKALTDSTPQDIIRSFKLKKAAEFLLDKKNTVNDVVILTGFKNRTHFSKLFKEQYGVTPGKYSASVDTMNKG
ncbi:ATP-binding protein [Flammeovirga sp. SubArs3]|uniref:hybrid sensor histidine kinase/response regulator transcription factor n=1 Tax=Flammeovirga sp. SubArs3 TaxID=2995316 RepID=UPI00248D34C1|nr:ATP-binding protein [Flammeovirga sp. SubArs3]